MYIRNPKRKNNTGNGNDILNDVLSKDATGFSMGTVTSETDSDTIYFYGDVTQESCRDLAIALKSMERQILWESNNADRAPSPIRLRIQTGGGDLLSAFGIANLIEREMKAPVHTYAEGYVASAGTLISVVGQKRYIQTYTEFMVYELSSVFWGRYSEFNDEKVLLDRLMEKIVTIYTTHTNLKEKKVKKILKRDYWMDANKALKLGFVDEIV